MKIFIDFDDVLFNTRRFKTELLRQVFLKNKITKKEFSETYYTFLKVGKKTLKYYDPLNQIRELGKNKKNDTQRLKKDLANLIKNSKEFVYRDASSFLKKFNKKDLILISYGYPNFQKMKVENSNLSSYFSRIILEKSDKINIINSILRKQKKIKEENVYLIDNLLENLQKKGDFQKQIRTICLKRRDLNKYKKIINGCDFLVRNLSKAEKIINSLELAK